MLSLASDAVEELTKEKPSGEVMEYKTKDFLKILEVYGPSPERLVLLLDSEHFRCLNSGAVRIQAAVAVRKQLWQYGSSCGSTEAAVAVRKQLWQYGSSCGSTEAAVDVRKQLWKYGSSCGSTDPSSCGSTEAAAAWCGASE